jgi:hypothetical protein
MKIIDKTPLQDEKGEISIGARLQGTLKYGLSWYSDLEAQKAVIAQLERTLEKGYVLIRNFTLPGSEIVIPIILIGPPGIQVILVTQVKGFFEAKGDQWNIKNNNRTQPAGINLLERAAKYGRALQKYLQLQQIDYPGQIEPVLITANPGAFVDSMRPIARVVTGDAIKQFAASLLQARPVLRSEQVYEIADLIVTPRPPEQRVKPAAAPLQPAPAAVPAAQAAPQPQQGTSRSQAIFKSEQTPFNPDDLGFAFEDEAQVIPPNLRETSPAQPLPAPRTKSRKIMGMSIGQIAILAGMFVFWCCIMIAFGGYIYYMSR